MGSLQRQVAFFNFFLWHTRKILCFYPEKCIKTMRFVWNWGYFPDLSQQAIFFPPTRRKNTLSDPADQTIYQVLPCKNPNVPYHGQALVRWYTRGSGDSFRLPMNNKSFDSVCRITWTCSLCLVTRSFPSFTATSLYQEWRLMVSSRIMFKNLKNVDKYNWCRGQYKIYSA